MLFCKVSRLQKSLATSAIVFYHMVALAIMLVYITTIIFPLPLQSALLKTPNLDRIVALGFTETPLVVYTPVNRKGGCKPQGRPKAMGDTLFNLHYKPISVDLIEPASWCKHKRSHAASHVQSMHICMMQI